MLRLLCFLTLLFFSFSINHVHAFDITKCALSDNLGKSLKACDELLKSPKLDKSTQYLIYLSRGNINIRSGKLDDAIADYTKAIDLDQGNALGHYRRGIAYHIKGLFDAALTDQNKAIELEPENSNAYFQRAKVLIEKMRYKDAIADSEKAVSINARFAEAYAQLAVAHHKLGNMTKSLSFAKLAVAIEPKLDDVWEMIKDLEVASKSSN